MKEKELKILRKVRSYQKNPEIIEFEGCPRYESLDVSTKLVSFKKSNVKFEIICFKHGLLYYTHEKIEPVTHLKSIVIDWEF